MNALSEEHCATKPLENNVFLLDGKILNSTSDGSARPEEVGDAGKPSG